MQPVPWKILRNEKGAALILALLILALVTLIGISALDTSSLEIRLSGNEREYKRQFYNAEAAVMTAVQGLENLAQAGALPALPPFWYSENQQGQFDSLVMAADFDGPVDYLREHWNSNAEPAAEGAQYFAIHEGPITGETRDVGPKKHLFSVYGRQDTGQVRVLIKANFITIY